MVYSQGGRKTSAAAPRFLTCPTRTHPLTQCLLSLLPLLPSSPISPSPPLGNGLGPGVPLAFPFSFNFLYWEEMGIIDEELYRNLAISGSVILCMIVALIMQVGSNIGIY